MNFDHEQLRQAVRERRDREGLTLHDAATETGVSRSTLCRFLRGEGAVDIDTAAKLAEFVDMPMSQLTGEAAVTAPAGEVLASIEGLLRNDPKLTRSDAKDLMLILRTAYRRAVEK